MLLTPDGDGVKAGSRRVDIEKLPSESSRNAPGGTGQLTEIGLDDPLAVDVDREGVVSAAPGSQDRM